MKINIKGIWIPIEILTDKDLSDKEKLIYSIILYFSKEKDYCSVSNNQLAELLNLTINHVSKLISSLNNKKYVKVILKYKKDSKEIENRILKPIFKFDNRYNSKQQFIYNQNKLPPILKNDKDIKNNILKNNYTKEEAKYF